MRKTCAMIDVSSLFLFFSSNTCELNRCRQSAGALLPAQQHSNKLERTQNSTHWSALPHAKRKAPKAHAPLRLMHMLNKVCA